MKNSKTFDKRLADLQPSQLYVCREKLKVVEEQIRKEGSGSMEPIPLKKFEEASVCWEPDEWDWDVYRKCLRWCEKEGVNTPYDLMDRVIDEAEWK